MSTVQIRWVIAALALGLAVLLAAQRWQPVEKVPVAAAGQGMVPLSILAINDFHGNLRPPPGGFFMPDPADPDKRISVPAGGSEHMATLVKQLRAGKANSVFVAAGDLIGASPLLSALFHDEPTIEALSTMGLDISSVGNHEFDEGTTEILRMQNGGCHPVEGCRGDRKFAGAKFRYLAASTIVRDTGKPLLPAYEIREFGGIPVAFIGLTLKTTPQIVAPSGVASVEFRDEAETINALVPELKQKGVEAIVVLIHEGGFPTGGHNECPGISGPIVEIVRKMDKAVDIVVSGHTHRAYTCEIDRRLVTSGDKFGTLVTEIDVQLDPKTRDVASARANNIIVRTDTYKPDADQTALISYYDKLVQPLADRPVGSIMASLSRAENPAGESPLGQIVADAQLAATRAEQEGGAVIAFTNSGGIRSGIEMKGNGTVTFGEIFTAQPFGNSLVTITLTGAQIKKVLEQQWVGQDRPRILQVSRGFSYAWDDRRPKGDFIPADGITLNGTVIQPEEKYRIVVNTFLRDGGDNYSTFKEGTDLRGGPQEIKALEAYFAANSPLAPDTSSRIRRLDGG